MKLLKDNKALHAEEFSNASPYVIMFGPDKCGATNKVGALTSPTRICPKIYCVRSTSSSSTRTRKLESTRRNT